VLARIPLRSRPAVSLLLLAPVLGELVSGHQAPLEFLNPVNFVILALPYGLGALLCRELMVRWGRGRLSLIPLALAYGIYEEGIVARSLWDPGWAELGPVGAYSHWAGVTWTWAAAVLHFHATVSIGSSVLLAHLLHPERRHEPWLTSRQLVGCAIGLALWAPVLMVLHPFRPPIVALAVTTLLIAGLLALARHFPSLPDRPGSPVRPVWYGVVAGLATTVVFVVVFTLPEIGGLPPWPVSLGLALGADGLAACLILRWSGNALAWTDRHKLALVAGMLGFFVAFDVAQDLDEGFAGRSVVAAIAIAGLWWLARRAAKTGVPHSPKPA
jgi:hypothetical protein